MNQDISGGAALHIRHTGVECHIGFDAAHIVGDLTVQVAYAVGSGEKELGA